MRTAMLGLLMIALGACVNDHFTKAGLAPLPVDHAEIQACVHGGHCDPLCTKVFGLRTTDQIQECRIRGIDGSLAHVLVMYIGDDVTDYYDDDTYDDSNDDGSSDDGSDDGSGDDGSGDDGSSDGDGGDDGSSRVAPHGTHPERAPIVRPRA